MCGERRGGGAMIVVLGRGHTPAERDSVVRKIEEAGLRVQINEGVERIVIGVVGDSHTKELLRESLEAMSGVESVVRVADFAQPSAAREANREAA